MIDTYSPRPQVISTFAWADATHLLAAIAGIDDQRWELVRIPIDGSEPQVVDGPTTGR